ncbi:MAG: fatty acid desaturase [Candidatus Competibacteraceae bacterium]|nr:MAG: fatty acid desaturase [Candidatus Competibacteraceae bacterium]
MVHGFLDLSFWELVLATLLMTHVTIAAVTIFLHRAQAHRALDLHPVISHFFRFWLWLTTGMATKQWVAIHRKHHAKCETPDDPHSPQVLGIRKVLWEGAELYRSEALNSETMKRYGHGTPDDWLETHLYARYDQLGITLMLFVDLALFGVSGLTVWAIQLLWIPFWAAGVVNGLGHYWGYRNYEPRDASANLLPIGLIIGGEELHNNHHAFPSSAKLSNHWWEFDIGWLYIRILTILRLAHVKKIAPVPQQLPDKQAIDLDTLRAVVLGRLYVMADFGRNVVVPVLREELRKADDSRRRILRRTKGLLLREEARLDDRDRARLRSVLDMSQALCTVYEFRMSLQSLWNRTTVSHEKLLASLQDWCTQAEASGIQALQEFAQSLRGYSVRSI